MYNLVATAVSVPHLPWYSTLSYVRGNYAVYQRKTALEGVRVCWVILVILISILLHWCNTTSHLLCRVVKS